MQLQPSVGTHMSSFALDCCAENYPFNQLLAYLYECTKTAISLSSASALELAIATASVMTKCISFTMKFLL